MPREDEIVAGSAILCGAHVLVPLLRVRAHVFTAWAGIGEADVVAFVCRTGDGRPRLLALDDTLASGDAWSAWLAGRPALLDAIRQQLATVPSP